MAVTGLDHLYFETHSFDETRAFWTALGFQAVASWGEGDHRAGILKAHDLVLVIAQVPSADPPQASLYLKMEDPSATDRALAAAPAVRVTRALHASHWETQVIEVADPDGRKHNLEFRETTP